MPETSARAHRGQGRARGFTLAEVMVVVAIISVLATLAVYGVRRYIESAKSHEATNMIKDIKEGQESYRRETHQYKNVSLTLDAIYPARTGRWATKIQWGGGDAVIEGNWALLSVHPDGPVYFSYASIAGGAGASVPNPWEADSTKPDPNWPTPNDVWYLAKAVGDLNDDGKRSVFVGSSFTSEIWIDNEGE